MYFYKENIELHKLKAENSKFEFHAVNKWYEDIKNHGIKNHLIINDKNIIILGGTRYFILKLLKTNNYTKIPCIIYSNYILNSKKQITINTVSQLTGLTKKQIFRALLHESNIHSRRR